MNLSDQALADLQGKITALRLANSPFEIQKIGTTTSSIPSEISARLIPFLTTDVDHIDFPLIGGHAGLDCLDCHIEGEYANTPVECSFCHTLERDLLFTPETGENPYSTLNEVYPDHFEGECSDCHTIFHWDGDPWDHEEVTECSTCHEDDIPYADTKLALVDFTLINWKKGLSPLTISSPFHYAGDCVLCHQDTESWKEWDFQHNLDKCEGCHENGKSNDFSSVIPNSEECLRITECASCHVYNGHEENYGETCTSCHDNFENWLPAKVDHTGLENCYRCHADDKPKKHSNLMCSYCHITQDWTTIVFEHPEMDGLSCKDCHQAPDNHANGDCAICHTTSGWGDPSIFHAFSNCTSCHSAPAGHFPGACTTCHTTRAWDEIRYSHDGKFECEDCHSAPAGHYIGTCESCHFTNWWDNVDFDHTFYATNCEGCHSPWAGHDWPGECTDCHTTSDWYQIIYTHGNSSDCNSCHSTPSGHWSGQCSKCHNTTNWSEIDFDHTGFSDCKACHTRPANHSRGQCSRCHTTETWDIESPNPTQTPVVTVTPAPSETPVPTVTVEPIIPD